MGNINSMVNMNSMDCCAGTREKARDKAVVINKPRPSKEDSDFSSGPLCRGPLESRLPLEDNLTPYDARGRTPESSAFSCYSLSRLSAAQEEVS